jgi:hypothetical protein
MQALRALAGSQLKHATENQERDAKRLGETFKDLNTRFTNSGMTPYEFAHAQNTLGDALKERIVLQMFSPEVILAEIIFTSLFASFDAYVGHLLHNLYHRCHRLYKSFESRNVKVMDVLSRTRQEIIDSLIESEIDSLLRLSYTKLFEKLAKRFDVKTLTAFPGWTAFIEHSQRRHLITHCDGIVNKQYIDNCKSAGALDPQSTLGKKLTVSAAYLNQALDVVTEVGLKLGQVLWRASDESAINHADMHLSTDLLFELLKREQWTLALRLGEFGQLLAKRKNQHLRSDKILKIMVINHAQAAMWSNDHSGAMKIIEAVEWSGSAAEFRLAVACLKRDWDEAANLMRQAGKASEICPLQGYLSWPIFREFRKTPQFSDALKATFGIEFPSELAKAAREGADQEASEPSPPPSPPTDGKEGPDNVSRPDTQVAQVSRAKKSKAAKRK